MLFNNNLKINVSINAMLLYQLFKQHTITTHVEKHNVYAQLFDVYNSNLRGLRFDFFNALIKIQGNIQWVGQIVARVAIRATRIFLGFDLRECYLFVLSTIFVFTSTPETPTGGNSSEQNSALVARCNECTAAPWARLRTSLCPMRIQRRRCLEQPRSIVSTQ